MPLGSCGNAWGEPGLEIHLAEFGKATAAVGDALGLAGFSGIFGVDFVLGPGGSVVVEANGSVRPCFFHGSIGNLRQSPISFVRNMRTPLLIVHSENDLRCPVNQAEELFVAAEES